MPRPPTLLLILALAGALPTIAAASEDEEARQRFHRLVAEHRYPLTFSDGRVDGPGAAWLLDQGARADLFVIGEQHATADIARFSHHLFTGLMAHGYRKMALEAGPWSTAFAERLMRQDEAAYEAFMSAEATWLALPFLFFREESELVQAAVRADDSPPTLWGLDQEFIAAAPILLPELARRAATDAERQAVATAQAAADDNPMFVGTADPSALTALREAFAERGDPQALRVIDDMIVSNRIYRPFTGRGGTVYEANLERENYMKARFLDAYRHWTADGSKPKVFLKFGAYHGSRGRSGTQVPALADFLVEWGRSEGLRVFNLHIDCDGGSARDIRSGQAVPCGSYFSDGVGEALVGDDGDGGLAVLDLRPLRPWVAKMTFLDRAIIDLVFAYDAYLALPDVEAASTYRVPQASTE